MVNLKIYGKVHGVLFRRYAKAEADELGLVGWVRNNKDGSVEIVAQGDEGKLKQFVDWCKKGPPMANVDRVEEDWLNEGDEFEGFSII
ncbi:MAG: acylphosphatase [Candidatus Curtissbacteria bacterium]|nr:acylphosphatase [Candidatus Curtissbacteria bacterium]